MLLSLSVASVTSCSNHWLFVFPWCLGALVVKIFPVFCPRARSKPCRMSRRRRSIPGSPFRAGSCCRRAASVWVGWRCSFSGSRAGPRRGERAIPINLRPKAAASPAQAKSVILLMQNGGPSQMDLFEPKPALDKFDGKSHSIKVEMFQQGSEKNTLLKSPFRFAPQGRCGMELSEVIPHIGSVADDLCLVRSMHSEHNNHTEGLIMFMTGKIFQGRPSFGSWITYALGTENQNLPAYVVLRDPTGYNTTGTLTWSSGWLPALYRGTEFSAAGSPVLNLKPAHDEPAGVQEANLDFLGRMNRLHQRQYPGESVLETRIQNYELAARMQLAAGRVLDLSNETAATRQALRARRSDHAAVRSAVPMARKLVEAGVRFVQVHPKPFQPWDQHSNTQARPHGNLPEHRQADGRPDHRFEAARPAWTRRSWSGRANSAGFRFRKTATAATTTATPSRPSWPAADSSRASSTAPATTSATRRPSIRVSVPDLHATILHQLGLDHETLVYRHSGRDETLTDAPLTNASVVEDILDA